MKTPLPIQHFATSDFMLRTAFLLSLFAATSLAAQNQDEGCYELYSTTYELAADGGQTLHRTVELRLLTHTSFNDLYGETFVVYDPNFQTLEVNEAYTIQADGTKISLPDNAINESLPYEAAKAPAYNHLREAVITHTGLELGATIHLDYTLTTEPGFYSELEVLEELDEYAAYIKQRIVRITIPEGKTLVYDAPSAPSISGNTYTWTFNDVEASYPDNFSLENHDKVKVLYATTFSSNEEALLHLTDRTRDIVKGPELTKDTPEATLEAYADFMQHKMDVCQVSLAQAGYRFRPGGEVLSAGYGTSIERASLLARMLKAEGFTASLVAIYPNYFAHAGLINAKQLAVKVATENGNRFFDARGKEIYPATRADRDRVVSIPDGEEIAFRPFSVRCNADILVSLTGDEAQITGKACSLASDGKTDTIEISPIIVEDKDGYRLVRLPYVGHVESEAIGTRLPSSRHGDFEYAFPATDSVAFTLTVKDGKIRSASRSVVLDNEVGTVRLSIEVNGKQATVSRFVEWKKTIVPAEQWTQARALLVALTDHTYREILVK